jgi:hypothetical protein
MIEQAPQRTTRRDRGPRLFVLISTLAIGGVILYALLMGRDGFFKSVNTFFNATPAPSASPSDSSIPSVSPSP